ncbi:hypothetical protein, partial [Streptomyces violens]|uniref:hypothetical protein n=1 Tax=Streptomyces violens TaxID=66377 RepID=UPI001B806529
YLALTFGTLLSSQGTDASFGPVSPGPPGASLRCFTLYQVFLAFRTALFSVAIARIAKQCRHTELTEILGSGL